jgi:hypothetical protein
MGTVNCLRMWVTNQPTLHNNPKKQSLYLRKSFETVNIHLQDADALQRTLINPSLKNKSLIPHIRLSHSKILDATPPYLHLCTIYYKKLFHCLSTMPKWLKVDVEIRIHTFQNLVWHECEWKLHTGCLTPWERSPGTPHTGTRLDLKCQSGQGGDRKRSCQCQEWNIIVQPVDNKAMLR